MTGKTPNKKIPSTERKLERALYDLETANNAVKRVIKERDKIARRVDELMEKNSREHLTQSERRWSSGDNIFNDG